MKEGRERTRGERTGARTAPKSSSVVRARPSGARRPADPGAKTRVVKRPINETAARIVVRLQAFRRTRAFRALLLVLLFIGAGAVLGAGAKWSWSWLTHTPRLAIKEIVVRTGKRVSENEVRRLANLSEGDNILAFRLRGCVAAIEIHPWVKRAAVMRELPDRVVIEVVERETAAQISLGALYYVDDEGEIFKKVLPGETVDYPVFTGLTLREAVEDKDQVAPLIKLGLSVISVARDAMILPEAELSEVRLDRGAGVTVVRASDGLRLVLGRGDMAEKWRRAERALVELGSEAAKVAELDLNYENRVTVRLRSGYGTEAAGEKAKKL
jgi:cell division protein FtsQ